MYPCFIALIKYGFEFGFYELNKMKLRTHTNSLSTVYTYRLGNESNTFEPTLLQNH